MQLLTPVQVARCIVQGWPYTPDTLAICSWIAAEDGDAGALAVLTAPNRPAAGSGGNWGGAPQQNGFAGGDLSSRGRRGKEMSPMLFSVLSLLCVLGHDSGQLHLPGSVVQQACYMSGSYVCGLHARVQKPV